MTPIYRQTTPIPTAESSRKLINNRILIFVIQQAVTFRTDHSRVLQVRQGGFFRQI